jgi:hypothetical protein
MPVWIVERGEAVSFLVVALVLIVAIWPVARTIGAPARLVEERFWWGGLIFIVAGRLAYVAAATPDLLLDLMVVVRFTDGIEPLAGGAAALVWVAWRVRGTPEAGLAWATTAAGLTLAAAAYALTCPLRGACFGTTAPEPLGFPMHGLVEPRLATPVIEGIALLFILAIAVRLAATWSPARLGWTLLAALAATRLTLMPLTAAGIEAIPALLLAAVVLASTAAAWRAPRRTTATPRPLP